MPSLKTAVYALTSICAVWTILTALGTLQTMFGFILPETLITTDPVGTKVKVLFGLKEKICIPIMYVTGILAGIFGLIGLCSDTKLYIGLQIALNAVASLTTTTWTVLVYARGSRMLYHPLVLVGRIIVIVLYAICVCVSAWYFATMGDQPNEEQPDQEQPDQE
eukprot:316077_1